MAQPSLGQTHQNMWGQAGALSGARSLAMMDSKPGSAQLCPLPRPS